MNGWDGWVKADGPVELFLPRDAACKSWTVAKDWAWPASYTEVEASIPNLFLPIVLHLSVKLSTTGSATVEAVELEIATGAAASEVTHSTYCFAVGTAGVGGGGSGFTLPMSPTAIPAGTRVAARARSSTTTAGGAAAAVGLYIGGYDQFAPVGYPLYDLYDHLNGVHGSQMIVTPAGSALSVTAAARPNFGNWYEVLASTPSDVLVWGASFWNVSALTRDNILQFGVGAAGSEVPKAAVGFAAHNAPYRNSGLQWLRRPLLVGPGKRIAVRASGVATASNYQIMYEVL